MDLTNGTTMILGLLTPPLPGISGDSSAELKVEHKSVSTTRGKNTFPSDAAIHW